VETNVALVQDLDKLLTAQKLITFSINIQNELYEGKALALNESIRGVELKSRNIKVILNWNVFTNKYGYHPVLIKEVQDLTPDVIQKNIALILRLQDLSKKNPINQLLPKKYQIKPRPIEITSKFKIDVENLSEQQKRVLGTAIIRINKEEFLRFSELRVIGNADNEVIKLKLQGTFFAKEGLEWVSYLFEEIEDTLTRVFNKKTIVDEVDASVVIMSTLPAVTSTIEVPS
jgi:hypothetical protein